MKKILVLVATVTMLLGCASKPEEPAPAPKEEQKIPINISVAPYTKVTDLAFETGDAVGLYVVNQGSSLENSGNHADNQRFSFDGSTWKGTADLYWKDQTTPASFYCYYPYAASVTNVKAMPFAVKSDQSTKAGYVASELLWGSKAGVSPTSSVVEIVTTHRMSNMLIYVLPGNGYTAESMKAEGLQVTINNLKVNATLDLETGAVTATGNVADITPYAEADHFRALVPPQAIQNETLISLKVGSYSFSLKETLTLKSNTQHKVTLTVNKVSEGVNIGIGAWEVDENDYGGTVN